MGAAATHEKTIVPIMLGVPFSEWPPEAIGDTKMTTQFRSEATGDMRLFVDFGSAESFHTKFKKELKPRLIKHAGYSEVVEGASRSLSGGAHRPGKKTSAHQHSQSHIAAVNTGLDMATRPMSSSHAALQQEFTSSGGGADGTLVNFELAAAVDTWQAKSAPTTQASSVSLDIVTTNEAGKTVSFV